MSEISAESMTKMMEVLPPEIIIRILGELDALSLLQCKPVCRIFNTIISETADLTYKIELYVSGQVDGQSSTCTVARKEKLELLKNQQARWAELRWSAEKHYRMRAAGLWELFGNVLAQNNPDKSFNFVQLPSIYRNIPEREWSLKFETPEFVRDFGMDPSQDLLVLVEIPPRVALGVQVATGRHLIHLQTLSTHGRHPLASGSGIIAHHRARSDPQTIYSIQVSSDFVGIFFHASALFSNEFIIWEWKTGAKKLHLESDDILSFCFLTERHVLFSIITDLADLELLIVDFGQEGHDKKDSKHLKHSLRLSLPSLLGSVHPLMFTVRSDPSPGWTPHPDLEAPFHMLQNDDKIIVASLWVRSVFIRHLTLVIAQNALLSHLDRLGPGSEVMSIVEWDEWGPKGTRLSETHQQNLDTSFDTWACYVYGTRFILPEHGSRTARVHVAQVFDFNQRALRRDISYGLHQASLADMDTIPVDKKLCVTAPSIFKAGNLFENQVTTELPFRWIARSLPDIRGNFCSMMCSEDAIIVVDDDEEGPCYRFYSF